MAHVTPRIDLVFKKLFGVEENKDLLISLLNSILSKEDQVSSVEILNPYNLQNFREEKLSILDIKARGETGHYYNIEIQVTDAKDYEKRALYYWAKLYTSQLYDKGLYGSLQKAIGIHILNFTSIPGIKAYHNTFHLQPDTDEGVDVSFFKDIELHTIELKKFQALSDHKDEKEELRLLLPQVKTALDRWAAFLSKWYLFEEGPLPREMDDPGVRKALDILEYMKLSRIEREVYENRLKWFRDEASAVEKAEERAFENGLKQGFQQGIEQGIQQGRQEEREKAQEEVAKAQEEAKNRATMIARTCLDQGFSPEVTAAVTGLSLEDVLRILGEKK